MKTYWESFKELMGIVIVGAIAFGILFIIMILLERSGGHRLTFDSILSLF